MLNKYINKILSLPYNQIILLLTIYFCFTAYLPFTGKYFFGDDFFRLVDNSNKMLGLLDIGMDGFFRPINHLSFYICIKLFGFNPYPYGLCNFLLFLTNLILGYYIFNKITSSKILSSIIIFIWSLNFKIAQNTLLMIVGRTETLWVFFFFLAIITLLYIKNTILSLILFNICIFLSLLSKETAIMTLFTTPIILKSCHVKNLKIILTLCFHIILTIIYLYLRKHTNAWDISTAPDLYTYNYSFLFFLRKISYYIFNVYLISLIPILFLIFFNSKDLKNNCSLKNRNALLILLASIIFIIPTMPVPIFSHLYAYISLPFLICSIIMFIKNCLLINNKLLITMIIYIIVIFPISQRKLVSVSLRSHTVSVLAENIKNLEGDTATIDLFNNKFDTINLEYALKVKKLSRNTKK